MRSLNPAMRIRRGSSRSFQEGRYQQRIPELRRLPAELGARHSYREAARLDRDGRPHLCAVPGYQTRDLDVIVGKLQPRLLRGLADRVTTFLCTLSTRSPPR